MNSQAVRSNLYQAALQQPASRPTDAVRLDQLQTAISGVPQFGHRHSTDDVQGLGDLVFYSDHTDTMYWEVNGRAVTPNVRLAGGGGLIVVAGQGLALDFGSGPTQAAAGNHSHAQLHDALTLTSGVTIGFSLNGQILGGEVRFAANQGLKQGAGGLALDFGTGPGQAAAGNHSHAQLHDPLTTTAGSTGTVALSLAGQVLSADVQIAGGGALKAVPSQGLAVDLGTSGTQAAAGNHTHADATASAPGFLSVADKQKLDLYAGLLNADECVPYYRHDACPAGEYVGGRRRWGQAMQIVEMHLTANPPVGTTAWLGLEVDGAVVEMIAIPAGTPPTEVLNQKTLSAIYVAASKYVRLVMVSGTGAIENEAARVDCALTVKPALASLSAVRVNAGGGAVSPFSADAYYGSGGTAQNTTNTVDASGVTSPAPVAAYQSARVKYNDANPFSYLFTGLARGINYTVRLHFAELYWNSIGDQRMNLTVIGKTTAAALGFDILNATSGVKFKAVVQEFTVAPDSNGQMEIRLTPAASTSNAFNLSINAIELIPNS